MSETAQPVGQESAPPMTQQPAPAGGAPPPGYYPPPPAPSGPVMNQATNVVVNVDGGGKKDMPVTWSTGLLGCFEDIGICICGWFCPPILGCQVATAMQENCCVPNCLPQGYWPMRTKIRVQYDILGGICDDWCVVNYCGPLVLCQIAREMRNHGQF